MNKPNQWNPRRIILGALGAAMVLVALYTYFVFGYNEANAFLVGVCSKVGIVLLTIFLAWPSLEQSIDKAPMLLNLVLLGSVIFIAIRPRLLPLIVGLVVVSLLVHFGLRFAANRFR